MPSRDAQIKPLTLSDLDGALTLSTTIGWNQRAEDWRMLLHIAPAASFARGGRTAAWSARRSASTMAASGGSR